MSLTYTCENECCTIKINRYDNTPDKYPRRGMRRKAGVFLYDPGEDRVLLVQSRGELWGPPKGSVEMDNDEDFTECAIRELKEETGLDIKPEDFSRATCIKNRAWYYYTERKSCDVDVQLNENHEQNDANGITWIKIDCLKQLIEKGHIVLNQHCKKIFKRFMNITFPKSDFVRVKRR